MVTTASSGRITSMELLKRRWQTFVEVRPSSKSCCFSTMSDSSIHHQERRSNPTNQLSAQNSQVLLQTDCKELQGFSTNQNISYSMPVLTEWRWGGHRPLQSLAGSNVDHRSWQEKTERTLHPTIAPVLTWCSARTGPRSTFWFLQRSSSVWMQTVSYLQYFTAFILHCTRATSCIEHMRRLCVVLIL